MKEKRAITLCLRHRDPMGFEFLVKKYRREAYYHAMAFMGNPEDAADACQESFTRAFAALPGMTRLTSFYPWFYRILRNCCLNMLDRRKTVDTHWKSGAAVLESSAATTPEDELQDIQDQESIWKTLATLKPEVREILVMKYVLRNTYTQIANNLGIPRGTVMSRLYHGRKAFESAYRSLPGARLIRKKGGHRNDKAV